MIYTNLEWTDVELHGMFESSNLKSTDVGNLYDVLTVEDETPIAVDNGVAVKIGEYTGNGLQEVYGTIAATTDKIAVTGSPAEIKDAFTTAQAQPYNFYHKAGQLAKAYEVVEGDIFAVAQYQFTAESADKVKFGAYVAVDGKGMWVASEEAPETGFVGKVHSITIADHYPMVRILCVKNEAAV